MSMVLGLGNPRLSPEGITMSMRKAGHNESEETMQTTYGIGNLKRVIHIDGWNRIGQKDRIWGDECLVKSVIIRGDEMSKRVLICT